MTFITIFSTKKVRFYPDLIYFKNGVEGFIRGHKRERIYATQYNREEYDYPI